MSLRAHGNKVRVWWNEKTKSLESFGEAEALASFWQQILNDLWLDERPTRESSGNGRKPGRTPTSMEPKAIVDHEAGEPKAATSERNVVAFLENNLDVELAVEHVLAGLWDIPVDEARDRLQWEAPGDDGHLLKNRLNMAIRKALDAMKASGFQIVERRDNYAGNKRYFLITRSSSTDNGLSPEEEGSD